MFLSPSPPPSLHCKLGNKCIINRVLATNVFGAHTCRLQEQTLSHQAQQKSASEEGPLSKPTSPIALHPGRTEPRPKTGHESSLVDTNVARWIEERDILLQTGVYTSSDPTIQKLDLKIRQALAEHAKVT